MKRKILARAASLSAAAALCCTNLPGNAPLMSVSAEGPAVTADNTIIPAEEESTELVNVVVKVSGKALLAVSEAKKLGGRFLMTDRAKELAETLKSTQEYVQRRIREIYPGLGVKYSYNTLFNGFSCEIPKNMINKLRSLPYVEAVTESATYYIPEMAEAPELGGYPSYHDLTGCTGEGQVVAVIDSELQLDHPMFAALDENISVKLTKEDIEDIVKNVGLNKKIDPDRAYRSSKVPYAVDYFDSDPYEGVSRSEEFPAAYHGTHVSGIAAGNRTLDKKGNEISGIARNAQLLFMAAANKDGLFRDAELLASFEDAVKLRADVINMSLGACGELFDDNPMKEALETAEKAGITVCISAGNEDNGESLFDEVHTPDQPDVSTAARMAGTGTGVLMVASADNICTKTFHAFEFGGDKIVFGRVVAGEEEKTLYLDDTLSGEYEFVYCGYGTPEELAEHDVSGKIVLADASSRKMKELSEYAKEAGAAGFIYVMKEGKSISTGRVDCGLPSGLIGYEDGQKMIEAADKRIRFTHDIVDVDLPTKVSEYTSYGTRQSLELRPDIMGVGGNVESASTDGKTEILSGTSMSSPYLAGCSAVLNEYLGKKGIALSGADKLRYMRNLMMTSAVPYSEDGMYVSPRRQGAGMVSLDRLLEDKVLLTGSEGESKIQLYDKLGDTFSFDINFTNISSEDVEFTSARLVLTTDSTGIDKKSGIEVIKGQQTLDCTAQLDSLLHTEAGEMRTETVTVSLDSAQTAAIKEKFVNGFFVEGYLLLEGADNCCDISVPILGFCGDWAAVPIFNEDQTGVKVSVGRKDSFVAGLSFTEVASLMNDVLALVPDDVRHEGNIELKTLFNEYATDDMLDRYEDMTPGEYYVSPNYDGLADKVGLRFVNRRYCKINELAIYGEDGRLISSAPLNSVITERNVVYSVEPTTLALLKDGNYSAELSACIDYESSREKPQTIGFSFKVDKKAPDLDASVKEKNGRKILTLTATDDALDGVYITGRKAGAEGDPTVLDSIYLAETAMSGEPMVKENRYISLGQPFMKKILTGDERQSDVREINFAEIFVAEPDENGSYTLEYDVTDLDSYTVTAMDKAYNMTAKRSSAIKEDEDTAKAKAAAKLIEALPDEVKLSDKAKVERARRAYDKLTDEQKELIDEETLGKLTDAEKAIAEAEADKAAADRVIKLINAIGTVKANDKSYEAIQAARKAYDALTDEQKELVTNYTKLIKAEQTYEELAASASEVTLTNVSSEKYGTLTIEWLNDGTADGYDILVWSSRRRGSSSEVYKFTAKGTESQAVIEDLAPNNRYYVKVRAYREINGKKVYGKYSSTASATVKGRTFAPGFIPGYIPYPGYAPYPGYPYPGYPYPAGPEYGKPHLSRSLPGPVRAPYISYRFG